MWIVALALRRPYTFVVVALLLLILGPIVIHHQGGRRGRLQPNNAS